MAKQSTIQSQDRSREQHGRQLPAQSSERGSTLLLAPIGLLIVMMLGAVTLEVGALHLRQRQLHDLATTIANDAATVGFDIDEFRTTGNITIDAGGAQSVVGSSIALSDIPNARAQGLSITQGAPPTIEIDLALTHEFVLGQLIWGASTELTASGQATLLRTNET